MPLILFTDPRNVFDLMKIKLENNNNNHITFKNIHF